MDYCIVEDGVIVNMIVAEADFAAEIGAVASYEGAHIGGQYKPPIPISQMDHLEAQMTYAAMMTGTLIGG